MDPLRESATTSGSSITAPHVRSVLQAQSDRMASATLLAPPFPSMDGDADRLAWLHNTRQKERRIELISRQVQATTP
jgi:hypothetical protein